MYAAIAVEINKNIGDKMKKTYTLIAIVGLGFWIAGCNSNEVKSNLGDYQYMGVDPQIAVDIENQEMQLTVNEDYRSMGELKYDVKLNYKINITQHNKELPLKKYSLFMSGKLVDEKNNVKDKNINIHADVTNGVASITDTETIYTDFKSLNKKEIESLKLVIDSYTWSPNIEYKPYTTSNK